MTLINRTEVPQYLRKGEYYKTLSRREDEKFRIPQDCLKPDLNIQSDHDLNSAIRSLCFWKVNAVPSEIIQYVVVCADKTQWWCKLVRRYPEYRNFLESVYLSKRNDAEKIVLATIHMDFGSEVVRCVHNSMLFKLGFDCWILAARLHAVSLMIFLEENNVLHRDNHAIVVEAAKCGSLRCLKHFLHRRWRFPAEALVAAAQICHLGCVQFLHEECGLEYTDQIMAFAVKSGDLRMIQYLHKTKCPWGEDVCVTLAQNDHFECLKFAHEKGCPWDIRTCQAAARRGSLRCLEYAHLQGCDWDVSVAHAAEDHKHEKCFRYARQHRWAVPFAAASSVLFAKIFTYSIVFTLVHEMYRTVVVCQLCALLMYLIDKHRYSQYALRLGVPEFEQKKIRLVLYNAALVSLCLTVVPVMCDLWYGGLSVKCRVCWMI